MSNSVRQVSSGLTFSDSSRHTPYGKYKYVVEIDGFKKAGFHKVSGLEATTEVRKYRDGGDNHTYHKAPGLTDFTNITLERGMSEDLDFNDWYKKVFDFDGKAGKDNNAIRKDLSIVLQDHDGSEVKRWNVYRAFPSSYKFDELDAESSDNMLEYLIIEHEGFELV